MHITKIKAERPYVYETSGHIIMRVGIKGAPDIGNLKNAIVKAVQKFPILNSRILMDTDGECYYVPSQEKTTPQITVYDKFVDTESLINEECRREFDIQKGEFVRFIIVQNNEKTEMNVIQHHIGGDGKSMLLLIESIMNNLAGKYDPECEQDIKVFDEKFLSQYVEANDLVQMTVDSFNQKWSEEGISFDWSDRTDNFNEFWSENNVTYKKIEFNEDELHSLLEECKNHGVTLNNLITTLMFKAKIDRDFKIGLIFDTRTKGDNTMGNYVGAIRLENVIDNNADLWNNIKYIDELVKSQLVDRRKLLLGCLVKCKISSSLMDAPNFKHVKNKLVDEYLNTFMFGTSKDVVCLSNLGVAQIEQNYGSYEIDKIEFISPLVLGFACNVSAVTINNNFIISMSCYDKSPCYLEMINSVEADLRSLIHNKQREKYEDLLFA